ncbi:hypothetical protein Hdeb2414_s0030g00707711 [Helianthus debilis subsp. tardiflorus]
MGIRVLSGVHCLEVLAYLLPLCNEDTGPVTPSSDFRGVTLLTVFYPSLILTWFDYQTRFWGVTRHLVNRMWNVRKLMLSLRIEPLRKCCLIYKKKRHLENFTKIRKKTITLKRWMHGIAAFHPKRMPDISIHMKGSMIQIRIGHVLMIVTGNSSVCNDYV